MKKRSVYCTCIIFACMLVKDKLNSLLIICVSVSMWIFLPLFISGQTQRIDKLRKELYSTNIEAQKVSVLLSLFQEARSMTSDNLLSHVTMAEKLTKPNTPEYFIANTYKGFYFLRIGDGSNALLQSVS